MTDGRRRGRLPMNSFRVCRLGTSCGTRVRPAERPPRLQVCRQTAGNRGQLDRERRDRMLSFLRSSLLCAAPPWSHGSTCSALWRMVPVNTRVRPSHVLLVALLMAAPAAAQVATQTSEKVDYDAIYRIKEEGFQRSQVMDTASWLTDVYGPRLTGSPSFKAAADWAVKRLTEWGAQNPHIESWGTFGRGWVNERFSATVVSGAQPWTITGVPKAWTPGIDGTVTAEAVFAPMETEADLEKWKGKLAGKIVLAYPTREVKAHFEPEATRMTEADLAKLSTSSPTAARGANYNMAALGFSPKRLEFLQAEGVAGGVRAGARRRRHDVRAAGRRLQPEGARRASCGFPRWSRRQVVIAVEHYGRLVRTLEKNVPVSDRADDQEHDDRGSGGMQRHRRNARHRQGRRDRDARRALRRLARRHRRHRQRGRIGGDAGGDAHPQGVRREDAPHRAPRAVGRRGAGPARLAGVREGDVRRPRDDAAEAGAREDHAATSTSTTAPAPFAASTCRATRPSRRSSPRGCSRSTTWG